ncbi:hypothetical protein prwr041_03460 [Prevotella herbatica]|uniref:DUF4906 domain-containing protein n=2 Tax=Prevotella herbatica TaxID=2801997 RepID=A0ABM7NVC7_9BACT|nr:hypothetical protein prwr041_03460 [Prevotella herbatica]
MALGLSSCVTDDSVGPFSKGSSDSTIVRLTFNINDGAQTRSITADNENTVNDITILVFDAGGSLIGSKYVFPVSSIPVDVPVTARSASGSTIYAIANTGPEGYFAGINTIDQLNNMSTTISSPSVLESDGSISGSNGALMVGKAIAEIPNSNKIPITLYHQCGKFSFTINAAAGVTITGYQLCHVPLSSYITDSHVPVPPASTVVGPPAGSDSYNDFAAVSGLNLASLSKTYYVYENLCGSSNSVTDEKSRNSSNAPTTASYLLVNAKGSGWKSTYRIYLGGMTNVANPLTDLTNFNVYRNLNYNCTINLGANGGNGDARVTYTATVQDTRTTAVTGTAVVGTYLYSDGKTGTTTDGHTVVGIVFSNQLSSTEYNAGYTHGYALALKNVSTSTFAYKTTNDESNLTKVQTFSAYYNDINAGYYGTFIMNYDKSNATYPAWQLANNYNVNISGFKNSGWYLPSIGQWWDVCANLGKVDLSGQQTSNKVYGNLYGDGTVTTKVNNAISAAGGIPLNSDGYYWSASELSVTSCVIIYINVAQLYIAYTSKNGGCYVRAVLAF